MATGFELRRQLEDVGLTQTRLARTVVDWGDPRSFEVVRRWVQRAAEEDAGANHHISMVLQIIRKHIDRRNMLRKQLHLFDTKKMWTTQDMGQGRHDSTEKTVAELERQKSELDILLKECKPPVYVFASKNHPDRYGFCESNTGDPLPAHDDWHYIVGSAVYEPEPPKLGKLADPIVSDITRWGFSIVSRGSVITKQF